MKGAVAGRDGFSLLEVILALAILGGAIAVLGEAARLALRSAEYTRDLARAQLLCESKLSEIVAGITPAQTTERASLGTATDPSEPAWLYSIETASAAEPGLLSVRVTVMRDLPAEKHPARFSLALDRRSQLGASGNVRPRDSARRRVRSGVQSRRRPMKRPGFTLLEIVLVLALLVVVLGLLGMAVDVHLRVADGSRNAVEETQLAHLVLQRMGDDLRNASPFVPSSSSGGTGSGSGQDASQKIFFLGGISGNSRELLVNISRLPLLAQSQGTASAGDRSLPGGPSSDVRTVSYRLVKAGDPGSFNPAGANGQPGGLVRGEWDRASTPGRSNKGKRMKSIVR